MDRTQVLAGLTLAALAALGGCARETRSTSLVVGSKNFTEQTILGEIAAQQLERRLGAPVTRRLDLGGTLLAHQALTAGHIDLYPEYTGTALTAILKKPAASDPKAVFEAVSKDYESRWKLRWMPPLGFDDTFAMVVRGADAKAAGIRTLSQAAARTAPWKLGVGYEFLERPDGLTGLKKAYPLRLAGPPHMMDLGVLYKALEAKEVDMVAANATDGLLSVLDVVVLEDDRRFFPPYEAAFVVRSETLARDPRVAAALEELSGKITSAEMRRLNHEVAGRHRRAAEVARDFLEGLTKAPAAAPKAP
jgi:glycine betaine/choline ABC-type transport system substrate-binding protein